MRAVTFKASPELLADLLHLPPGATIYNASAHIDPGGHTVIVFAVDDPSLPEADIPHEGDPSWTQERVVFNGWGLR